MEPQSQQPTICLSLFSARSIQSMTPNPTSWRSILILFTHLRLTLPSSLFPSGYPVKSIYASLLSPIHATCPAHLKPPDCITRIILGKCRYHADAHYEVHSPVTLSFLDPIILISSLFSNTLSYVPAVMLRVFKAKAGASVPGALPCRAFLPQYLNNYSVNHST
jgi:hypothetical protein